VFGLVMRALRARRAQALTLCALALLAGLGSAAAPWFLAWANDAVATSHVTASDPAERVISGGITVSYDPDEESDPIASLRGRVGAVLALRGASVDAGARLLGSVNSATTVADPGNAFAVSLTVAARDGVCAQLRVLEGACPDGAGTALLPREVARLIGVGVGDEVRVTGVRLPQPVTLRVSGLYEVIDPYSPYWAATGLLPDAAASATSAVSPPPLWVSPSTLLAAGPDSMELDYHLVVPVSAMLDPDARLGTTINRATFDLERDGISLDTSIAGLLHRIAEDRRLLLAGVWVGVAQLVLVCWVGLFLAVRHTADERRADVALLRLRGVPGRRIFSLVARQSALPMVAGSALGALLALGVVAALAGSLTDLFQTTTPWTRSVVLSLAAAALAGLGGLIAAIAAEWQTLRSPVMQLLRRVPGGPRGWRADVLDLVVVGLAAAGVYQGHAEAGGGQRASVLALLTPVLVGLAVALLVARALPPLADRIGVGALRSGRVGLALSALQLGRREGTRRIFAVLVVAAAVGTTTAIGWHGATSSWHERAVTELGADRVLSVGATNATALLTAVREVDPQGRYAMAVALTQGPSVDERVVAVDTTRLARVGQLPDAAGLADALRPRVPQPPLVHDGPLTLDVRGPRLPAGVQLGLRLNLSTVDGLSRTVEFTTVGADRATLTAAVTGCAPACRLGWVELVGDLARLSTLDPPAAVELYGIHQSGAAVVTAQQLGDVTRWRTPLARTSVPLTTAADGDHLTIAVFAGSVPMGWARDPRVLPATAPVPLPAALAGTVETAFGDEARLRPLGGTRVPYQLVAEVPVLPRVGAAGALVDLEYALLGNDGTLETAQLEVWLAPDAPPGLVAALEDHGVRVLAEESVTARAAELGRYGSGLALRFQLLAAVVILLLAAGVVVVGSTVDRSGWAVELAALRQQGLAAREVRVAGYTGPAALVLGSLVTGVGAALLARALVASAMPVFADDWALTPLPSGLTAGSVLVAGGVVVAVVGIAAATGAARLVATVIGRRGGDA
jgi:putative ABC transport system permease protein